MSVEVRKKERNEVARGVDQRCHHADRSAALVYDQKHVKLE